MTTAIDAGRTLGDIVAELPSAARTLDRLGLDYCCHGGQTLGEAASAAGLDPDDVAAQLRAAPLEGDATWTTLEIDELADHIVATHHRYLWEELPLLDELAEKVLAVHGERHPELIVVRSLVAALRADLEPHLQKEERVLFPAIHDLVAGQLSFAFGGIGDPIRVMEGEHERAGELLHRLRSVTRDFAPPADGCASYRSLFERLEALELDTHLHIHKENHRLFPAALDLAEG